MSLISEKFLAKFLVSVLASLICWTVINEVVTPIGFGSYLFIEFLLLGARFLYIFVWRQIDGYTPR
jgi:hypothetical protein